jgi:hypothetical protein
VFVGLFLPIAIHQNANLVNFSVFYRFIWSKCMKSSHIRFEDHEYEWLQAAAKADRRSVSSMVELLVVAGLERLHADKKPYVMPKKPVAYISGDLFDDEPQTSSEE